MPNLPNAFEQWVFFTLPMYTMSWLITEIVLVGLTSWLVACRLAVSPALRLNKAGKARAAELLRQWAYHRSHLLRVSQSPACHWLLLAFIGGLTAHLAVLYPSVGARAWSFNSEAAQVRADRALTHESTQTKLTNLGNQQHRWLKVAKWEAENQRELFWSPFPRWEPSAGTLPATSATEASNIVQVAHTVEVAGLLSLLLGLVFAFRSWLREPPGERHHGKAAWAARSEVTFNASGYFRIPVQVSQDGSRKWEKTYSAPYTVLAPSRKSNWGHGLMIGATGGGKGAYSFGHFFATSSVPIIYQDAKGECPAWTMHPKMVRFGIPAHRPKGLPSMRINPIAEVNGSGLSSDEKASRAIKVARLLLPSPAEKTINSWINDTAVPLLADGLIKGRWRHLGELADEIEGHPLPFILSSLAVAAGRRFSLAGKNVLQYAANELSNNTQPYLRGWARHAFSASDFTVEDVWSCGAYVMTATEDPQEKIPIQLFWNLLWNDAQSSDKPLPCLVLIDEGIAAGRIPGIIQAANKLRDRGFSVWMAFQNFAGIVTVYGKDDADTLRRSLVNTVVLTNGLDAKDAAEVVEEMGHWTLSEKNKSSNITTRTKFPLLPYSDLLELAGQEDEFWAIFRGRGMSRKGRPVLARLHPMAPGAWNCLATEDEHQAQEEKFGHHTPVESRFAYTLSDEYRQAATLALDLANDDNQKIIALFQELEALVEAKGLESGTVEFIAQKPAKKAVDSQAIRQIPGHASPSREGKSPSLHDVAEVPPLPVLDLDEL
jgi:hypothetical protein